MPLPNTNTPNLPQALIQIQNASEGIKTGAASLFMALQNGPVTSDWVFNFLDRCIAMVNILDKYKSVTGLTAYAQEQIPGYVGTITTDIATTRAAIISCVAWVTTNFPKDTTNTYILSHVLNEDGSRTPRTFTSAQTTGLQTVLQTLIATIS